MWTRRSISTWEGLVDLSSQQEPRQAASESLRREDVDQIEIEMSFKVVHNVI